MKLKIITDSNDEKYYSFYCKCCGHDNVFNKEWSFNGDMNNPTFSPSLLNWLPNDKNYRCHLFVKNGKIEYLLDCTHNLAGKIVDMEEVE